MGLRDIVNRLQKRKEIFKEMQDHDNASTKLAQRKISSEERALNAIREKRRQEIIKAQLKAHYKKEDKAYWKKDVISQPNMFREHGTLLQQKNLFAGGVQ